MSIQQIKINENGQPIIFWADGKTTAVPNLGRLQQIPEAQAWLDEGGQIIPYPQPTPAEALALAKREKHRKLKRNVQRFICFKPDGSTRYDTDLKLNLMDYISERKEAGLSPAPADAVRAWIREVQGEYRELCIALKAAVDQAGVEALDISLARLEGLFGVQGSRTPDPDVYTSDLWGE
ncbi:hypothetical protein [Dethiosulfatarculus sandiegensis]|uniref:Uncharacterized protein n=1 Tax=Dethiosulfatarculus sandiegensis TaxID=1429043 RepID=A0A0D2GGJ7_9BACT|nr:hypothetical protein [Dethiosulfatarculus sandiegensis]KIX14002.1 hypothetical protein X474_13050 [Dethiosulfatarculus sandiegensis]